MTRSQRGMRSWSLASSARSRPKSSFASWAARLGQPPGGAAWAIPGDRQASERNNESANNVLRMQNLHPKYQDPACFTAAGCLPRTAVYDESEALQVGLAARNPAHAREGCSRAPSASRCLAGKEKGGPFFKAPPSLVT